jgi:flavin-dependent dehydrogenase
VDDRLDLAVIGAGPAGSTLACLAARQGLRVALYEQGEFPRFHIGESLVPAVNLTLEHLGILGEMDAHGYPRKNAVQFFSPRGASRPFYFTEASDPRLHHTWQVLRSDFDALLADTAREAGAAVHTRTRVTGVLRAGAAVTGLRVRHDSGPEERVTARVVADASGQKGLLARSLGRRQHIPDLENVAIYAHYRDARRDEGRDAGSTLILRISDHSWLWFIPLPCVVSVGLVAPARHIASRTGTPTEILDDAIAACPPLQERLRHAARTNRVRVERDFSYRATHDGGPGWLLVGDALGFIDPMYSTGLFLSLYSAELAAQEIAAELAARPDAPDLAGFSREYQAAFDKFLALVRAFYRSYRFGTLAENPRHRQGLIDLLIGDVRSPLAEEVVAILAASEH